MKRKYLDVAISAPKEQVKYFVALRRGRLSGDTEEFCFVFCLVVNNLKL